jgi:hypothetical protein
MPVASIAPVVNSLLKQLSSDLGFSMAARAPTDFIALAVDIDTFADKVLALEGMDPATHSAARAKVRALVAARLSSKGPASEA